MSCPAYFTISLYNGYGSILIHFDKVDAEEAHELLFDAWDLKASKKLKEQRDGVDWLFRRDLPGTPNWGYFRSFAPIPGSSWGLLPGYS